MVGALKRSKMRNRPVMVRLTDQELARLDEFRPSGMTRPAFLRSLLRQPPRDLDIASREEALAT